MDSWIPQARTEKYDLRRFNGFEYVIPNGHSPNGHPSWVVITKKDPVYALNVLEFHYTKRFGMSKDVPFIAARDIAHECEGDSLPVFLFRPADSGLDDRIQTLFVIPVKGTFFEIDRTEKDGEEGINGGMYDIFMAELDDRGRITRYETPYQRELEKVVEELDGFIAHLKSGSAGHAIELSQYFSAFRQVLAANMPRMPVTSRKR